MAQTKKVVSLYEESEFIYVEGNILLLRWANYALKERELSKSVTCKFVIIYTACIVNLYSKILVKSLGYVKKAINIKFDDYMCLLLESILLYKLGKIKPAILSFRRAFNLRNKNCKDPFYKRTFLEKEKLYENIISEIDWKNITDKIFDPDLELYKKNNKPSEALVLTLEQLKQELCKHDEKINVQIEILQNTLNKSSDKEIIEFILEYASSFFDSQIAYKFDFFYIHGNSLLKIASLENRAADLTKIFDIYTHGLSVATSKDEITISKLKNYKKSIIDLIKSIDKKMIIEKEYVGIKAIREIGMFSHEASENIEENKHLCLCDIYMEIGKYFEAIKSYLDAAKFLDESDLYAPFKYSEKLVIILKKIDIEEMKKLLMNISKSENFNYNNKIYGQMWYVIGKNLYSEAKKDSESREGYFLAIKAYTEALTSSDKNHQAKILFSRGMTYVKTKNFSASETDFDQALEIDQKNFFNNDQFTSLSLHEYKILLHNLAEIRFKQKIDFQNLSDLKHFFDKERQYYEQYIVNNNNKKIEAPFYFLTKNQRDDIDKCHRRISMIYYAEGYSIYNICQKSQRSKSSFRIEPYIRYLEQSLNAYRKAFKEIQENIETKEEDYSIDYFMLEILTEFIMTSYTLLENCSVKTREYPKYQEYYKETQKYLEKGSRLLSKLVKAKEEGLFKKKKKYKYIQQSNFQKKFEIIEGFKISYFDEETALEQAEIRKNICLTRLLPYKKSHNLSYENIRTILSPNTAVVYWYVGITEVTSFILLENQYAPIKITNAALNYSQYIKLKRDIDAWELAVKEIGKSSTNDFLREMEKCLENLYIALGIQSILDIIYKNKDIKNIILVPHRYLHKIPLHIFFYGLYGKKTLKKDYSYTLSYLPSIELGLQLDSSLISRTNLLMIHPLNEDSDFLIDSYAESAGVYLRFYENSFKVPEKLEGDPDARREEVTRKLEVDINPSFLHFLGHAQHNFSSPKESWLELRGNKHLTLQHILNHMDFSNYYLVCLSACETGVTSTERPLNEYVGLVSAFLETGANYVISSLWKIEDKSSAFLIMEFYRLVNIHEHPVIALQKAQIWLRTSTRQQLSDWCKIQASELRKIIEKISITEQEKRKLKAYIGIIQSYSNNLLESSEVFPYKHPYYWAGFTITGLPPLIQQI